MEENTFVEKVIADLQFAAKTSIELRQSPKAFKQLIAYPQIAQKLVSGPVFFASSCAATTGLQMPLNTKSS